jgi:hypothetical protein
MQIPATNGKEVRTIIDKIYVAYFTELLARRNVRKREKEIGFNEGNKKAEKGKGKTTENERDLNTKRNTVH